MTDLSVPASVLAATCDFGRVASKMNSSASKTPPTNKKYRATGILASLPIRAGARVTFLN
jgi:hypothetical protein